MFNKSSVPARGTFQVSHKTPQRTGSFADEVILRIRKDLCFVVRDFFHRGGYQSG